MKQTVMFQRPLFIVKYWLGWILFFVLCKFAFLLSNLGETKSAGADLSLGSLFYGLRMDGSMAAYLALPVCLLVICSVFIRWFQRPIIYQVYTASILLLMLVLVVADIGLFKAWGSRLDA